MNICILYNCCLPDYQMRDCAVNITIQVCLGSQQFPRILFGFQSELYFVQRVSLYIRYRYAVELVTSAVIAWLI